MSSNATITTTNLELTPCIVTFNSVGLGATLSNVVITTKYEKSPLLADQTGKTVLDQAVSGIEITVTTELAEIQNPDIWAVVFPHADLIVNGSDKAVEFKERTGGAKDSSFAQTLTLHPQSLDASDVTKDHTFFKAVAMEDSGFTFSPTEQQKLKIVWRILPDTSVTPFKFYRYGDPALVAGP